MKTSTLTFLALAGCAVGLACQAIVGIEDRTEVSSIDDGGASSGSSSGASSSGASSSGGSSSGGSSSGSSGTDGGDGGDAAKPYDVDSLAGLKLWLESTKDLTSDASGFASWADQSHAPDAGQHIAEPQDPNPPKVVSNGINGRPTISFLADTGFIRIANHSDFQFGFGDFIIVVIAKVSSGDGPLWNLAPAATAGKEQFLHPARFCVEFGAGVTAGCTTPDYAAPAGPHVFVGRRKGDLFTYRVDGTVRGSLDRSSEPPDISIASFKQMYAFIGKGVAMQVSEVAIAVAAITDADLATLEGHLKGKYGIP